MKNLPTLQTFLKKLDERFFSDEPVAGEAALFASVGAIKLNANEEMNKSNATDDKVSTFHEFLTQVLLKIYIYRKLVSKILKKMRWLKKPNFFPQ